jgi:hypothetical protein
MNKNNIKHLSNLQKYVNHIVFLIDASGSMEPLTDAVVSVVDKQIQNYAILSSKLVQETRVSVYLFNTSVSCLIHDMDVMRLPSLKKHYVPKGGTALIDATLVVIDDMFDTSQKYGDHAFLCYVLTDGMETQSGSQSELKKRIHGLADNWTISCLVPTVASIHEAKKCGFPVNNIQRWDQNVSGVETVGDKMHAATDAFMQNRTRGIRSTKSLFDIDISELANTPVSSVLAELESSKYMLIPVHRDSVIKPLVTSWTKNYVVGSAYYQLTKIETIQPYKQICIQNKYTGKVYTGPNARKLIKLPTTEVKVNPVSHTEYDIFVQSTSTNRKLQKGTKLIVLL